MKGFQKTILSFRNPFLIFISVLITRIYENKNKKLKPEIPNCINDFSL
jgi:hypothetical protein